MLRTQLYANPEGRFLHDAVLAACRRVPQRTAIVDPFAPGGTRRITYAEYGELVTQLAQGLAASGVKPGDVVAILLANCWEYAAACHAITLAGAAPTMLNPSYREREVRYQLENSGAVALISDGPLVAGINLSGLPHLRAVYTIREHAPGTLDFHSLLRPCRAELPVPDRDPKETIAALPYSSGTTGLPKGVMLSHFNLMANIFQFHGPCSVPVYHDGVTLCFLPLYHIYGLNVVMNPTLVTGCTLVVMPRFEINRALDLLAAEQVTIMPCVPPVLNLLLQAAERGAFPAHHALRWVKSGAAPLAPELARRFTRATGLKIAQGYGMTEASPVTHVGFTEPPLDVAASIGQPVALTDCRIIDVTRADAEVEAACGQPGELVMRGPQFMLGYWRNPQATADVLRDGWYWSGDVATKDELGLYYIVDRRKEMIKYKGFPVAPAEIEAALLEHPAVSDCGVVGRPDECAGEVPCAFVVLREQFADSGALREELCAFVADRIAGYKRPREVRFVRAIPRNPSGKILRRELRNQL
ncbi:MAG TPA: class I adenylate-forming enzyme family protein [Terriglobales bacterium]|nr:class I adenylate-forming enzyme family protein [Terriglobales bacterium]